jgi:hypothetical protein
MNKILMLFAIFLGFLWFFVSTPTSWIGDFSEMKISFPRLFGGWGVIAGIVFLLVKLAKWKRNQIRRSPK